MAAPRFRGSGFRNVGGWEVRDKCARAGRNLNFASAGILLYQLSGARVGNISYGGATLPATHPAVFAIFGIVGFAWLGYRFLIAYRDARDTDAWWHLYLRDLVLKRPPVVTYAMGVLRKKYMPQRSGSMSCKDSVKDWTTLIFPEVRVNGNVVATDVEVEIPKAVRIRAHMYWFPLYLISNSDIADMIVPWMLAFLAVASIVSEQFGLDPAGFFGALPLATTVEPSTETLIRPL